MVRPSLVAAQPAELQWAAFLNSGCCCLGGGGEERKKKKNTTSNWELRSCLQFQEANAAVVLVRNVIHSYKGLVFRCPSPLLCSWEFINFSRSTCKRCRFSPLELLKINNFFLNKYSSKSMPCPCQKLSQPAGTSMLPRVQPGGRGEKK